MRIGLLTNLWYTYKELSSEPVRGEERSKVSKIHSRGGKFNKHIRSKECHWAEVSKILLGIKEQSQMSITTYNEALVHCESNKVLPIHMTMICAKTAFVSQ